MEKFNFAREILGLSTAMMYKVQPYPNKVEWDRKLFDLEVRYHITASNLPRKKKKKERARIREEYAVIKAMRDM